jgi:hypothetical protein
MSCPLIQRESVGKMPGNNYPAICYELEVVERNKLVVNPTFFNCDFDEKQHPIVVVWLNVSASGFVEQFPYPSLLKQRS